jgi:hypothetical protein
LLVFNRTTYDQEINVVLAQLTVQHARLSGHELKRDTGIAPGEAIYDPFLGSGTTLIATETTGRVCFGMEIDPLYVDVAVRRWQAFTGQLASLQADGRTFAAVVAERLPNGDQATAETAASPRQSADKSQPGNSNARASSGSNSKPAKGIQ